MKKKKEEGRRKKEGEGVKKKQKKKNLAPTLVKILSTAVKTHEEAGT